MENDTTELKWFRLQKKKIMYDYLYINEQGLLLTRHGTNIDTNFYSYMYVMTRKWSTQNILHSKFYFEFKTQNFAKLLSNYNKHFICM